MKTADSLINSAFTLKIIIYVIGMTHIKTKKDGP